MYDSKHNLSTGFARPNIGGFVVSWAVHPFAQRFVHYDFYDPCRVVYALLGKILPAVRLKVLSRKDRVLP